MSFQRPSNATAREFEATAIKKLVAEGVPKHVAHAFVSVGVMKNSQLYERLRDVVCPMEFQEFFIPVGPRDMQDPLREGGTGAMIPRVKKDDTPRFYTQFSMSDVEAVRFIKQYPELRIVNSGKVYNQHAYYANKRFADCELAISMVHRHSLRNGSVLDPRSLVDLGGNLSYHVKRDRDYVHVENPVLDARDKARYVVREVFSGEDPESRCQRRFEECTKKFDYAIGIHSTYDLDPRTIASAMHRRSIKFFVGFMNSIPGLPESPAGVYEADGLVATVDRPTRKAATARYTFKYDPSTEYVHALSSAASYLLTGKRYDFYDRDGSASSYLYRIDGFRGCTLVFTIEKVDSDVQSNPTVWTPRRVKQYYLTIKLLNVSDLAVDCELFDRLVLQAAAARNFSEYDIVSLYRYAKSLRQRMSLNGITLSSGFCINPQELVVVVVAAYTVAATFRTESTQFFKKATAQMMQKRGGQSFLRSLLSVTAGAFSVALEGLSSIVGKMTFYSRFNAKVKDMVSRRYPIEVIVDRPHAGKGISTMSHMVVVPPTRVEGSALVRTSKYVRGYTPLPVDGDRPRLVSTAVRCDGILTKFWTYGVPPLSPSERPRDCSPEYLDIVAPADYPVFSEEYRMATYHSAVGQIPGMVGFEQAPLVAANGDRVYRRAPLSSGSGVIYVDPSDRFQGLPGEYVVFRGVGPKAVMLGRPRVYTKGRCLAFVLFYDQVDDFRTYTSQQVTAVASEVDPTSAQVDTPHGFEREDWDVMFGRKGVKAYPTPEAAQAAVRSDVDAGLYVMSGALHPTASTPPLSGASTPVRSRADTAANLYRPLQAAVSEPGVPSQYHPSDVGSERALDWGEEVNENIPLMTHDLLPDEPGGGVDSSGERSTVDGKKSFLRSALEERIRACDAARRVALESSRAVIDMAIGVASGRAPASRWGALCQGVPGSPVIVSVRGDVWTDWLTGEPVEHMAVSDGDDVYDRLENPPVRDGTFVTSEVLRIYTGTGIRRSMVDALDIDYDCQVVSVNGVAGSGKTHQIVHEATAHDVVLCETSAAMKDTLKKLSEKLGDGVKPMGATVDSFLLHRQFNECAGLFIDESYRLHASSIVAAIRLLRPAVVYAFGDSKQIPLLPYIPEFDFLYGEYPFDRLVLKTDTWRCPADICLALSQPKYYGFVVTTHNLVRRSLSEPVPFRSSVFLDKPPHVVVLTYTKTARDDLKKQGVVNVMTIGQSQGSTFDDVILFRDSDLKKVLYYDPYQTLVAFTRHRRSFKYVTTAFAGDDSAAYKLIKYVQDNITDVVLASHMIADDSSSDSEIYRTRVSPEDDELFDDEDIVDVY